MIRKTEILIEITHVGDELPNGMMKTETIARRVTANGKVVYEDRMGPSMYRECRDPIRELELFLLGLKKGDSRKNVGFFKKKWQEIKALVYNKKNK